MNLIMEYIVILAPSVVSIFAMIGSFLLSIAEMKKAAKTFKNENLEALLKRQIEKDEVLSKQVDILIDEIKRIKEYRKSL